MRQAVPLLRTEAPIVGPGLEKQLVEDSRTQITAEGDGVVEYVDAPIPSAPDFCLKARDYELLLVPSDSFGCEGYVRISYCVSKDMILRSLPAFRALAQFFGL